MGREELIDILLGIIIAASSSWITVRLSLARFRSEKWWERKIEAYTKIIEAFHHSKSFSEKQVDEELFGKKTEQELITLSRAAQNEIEKYTDIGAFLFSNEFHSKLKQYQKDALELFEYDEGLANYLVNNRDITERYLQELIALAKKDLLQNRA